MIGSYEVEQGGKREARCIVPHGVDGVGWAAAAQFLVIDLALGPARERETQKAEPAGRGGGDAARFERRLRGGDEHDPVEFQFFLRRLGNEKVAVVDWIERSTKEPNPTRVMPRGDFGFGTVWHAWCNR